MAFHLLLLLMLSATSECLTMGKAFIAVFPENIAFYFPSPPENKLRFTGLVNGTTVTITPETAIKLPVASYNLKSGEMIEVNISPAQELNKSAQSTKAVHINSDQNITVEILSHRKNSIQTALLFPMEQLGTNYKVPPIPLPDQITTADGSVNNQDTERSPFKLIIANGLENNVITVPGRENINLSAKGVLQIWVNSDLVGKSVTGTQPFLVLFGHPCATMYDCMCGVLYTPLLPSSTTTSNFIVPGVFSEEASGNTYLIKPSTSERVPFEGGSLRVDGALLLQRPGLLINLIPEPEFGGCFAVQKVVNATENWAIVVTSSQDVMIGNSPASAQWVDISGTVYKYTKLEITGSQSIIWNKSAKMGVWYVGKLADNRNAWFGNPAARLSADPDYRGCAITPEKLVVLEENLSWKNSIQACKNLNLTLIGLSKQDFQNQVYRRILDMNQGVTELWMGMRKNSYNGVWYWLNEEPLEYMDWSSGFPGSDEEGRCAQIDLRDSNNPGWINKHCCALARPVCYEPPNLLTILQG